MNDPVADRNLALEAVRVTERTAIAASVKLGCGDEREADEAASAAMVETLNQLAINGTMRIGDAAEGALDVGKKVGTGTGPKADVAAVALEGKSIVARGGYNAISALAMAEEGGFLNVPPIYMEKIAVGAGVPEGVIDLDREPEENLKAVAEARGVPIHRLVVCLLDRPRHRNMVERLRTAGARVRLLLDGDVSGVVAVSLGTAQVDLFMGSGRAPQGVLAAAALRGLGGQMQARLLIRNDDDRYMAEKAGIADLDQVYGLDDLASGNVTFAATGVTTGPMLSGVEFGDLGHAVTHSMVVRSKSRTLRFVEGHHHVEHDYFAP